MDSHCSSPKTINSGVPQGSVISPTLYLLFINDHLNLTQCPLPSYVDDTTLNFSTSYNRRPKQQELNDSRQNAIGCLTVTSFWLGQSKPGFVQCFKNSIFTTPLSLVSDWGRAKLDLFNASKTQYLQLSNRHNFPDNYPLFFNDTQLTLASTLNTPGLSLNKNLNWQFHSATLANSVSKKLGVLLISFSQLLALYMSLLIHPCVEYGSHICGGSTGIVLLNRLESKTFRLINFPPLLSVYWLSWFFKSLTQCCIFISFLLLFSCWLLLNLLTACLPSYPWPHSTKLSTSSHPCSVYLSNARVKGIGWVENPKNIKNAKIIS